MLHHDLQTLRLIVAVCEFRSLSRAAAHVNMALSAASRRIRILEEAIGAPLMKRLPHGVEPTTAGIAAEHYAQSVLRLADQFTTNIEEHRSGIRGRIRVAASSSALVHRLALDLAAFARDHPEIKIDLEERPTAETLEALDRKQVDVGVIVRGVRSHSFEAFQYAQDRLAVAVPAGHWLTDSPAVKLRDFIDEELVALDAGTAVYRLLARKAREEGRTLKVRVQVRSFEAMCQMVQHGLGIGILPEAALRPLAEALGLRLITLDEPWAVRDIDVVVQSVEAVTPPVARLLRRLRFPDF